MADSPIGIFDSGYGGLTVMRAVLDQLPHESVAYFGDTARAPYGPRPIAEIRELALECLDRLVDHGVKILVIACNTASAAVLHDARERYDVPVVEVIRPAVRRAAAATRNGRVGVISTVGTHQSRRLRRRLRRRPAPRRRQHALPALRRVRRARGHRRPRAASASPTSTSTRCASAGVDTLVLGCTHYPLLTGVISYVMGDDVTLVSSAEETAKDVYRVLADADLLRPDDLPPPDHGVHHHRRPRRVPRPGAPVPRRRLDGSARSSPRRRSPMTAGRMRVTVVGCSGSFAGPRVARVVLPGAGRGTRAAPGTSLLDLGSGALGALQRHVDPTTSTPSCSATCTPTTASTCAASTSPSATDPRGPAAGPSARLRPGRHRRADGADVPTASTTRRHGGRSSTSATSRSRCRVAVGPFTVTPYAVNHPVEAYGLPGRGRRRACWPTPATPTTATPSPRCCTDADLVAADAAFVDGRDDVPGIHLTGPRRGRGRGAGRGSAAGSCSPTSPPWNDPEVCRAQAAAVWPGEVELAAPGARRTSS